MALMINSIDPYAVVTEEEERELREIAAEVRGDKNPHVTAFIRRADQFIRVQEIYTNKDSEVSFTAWIEQECECSRAYIYEYIRVRKNLTEQEIEELFPFGFTNALKVGSQPREVREEVTAKLQDGEITSTRQVNNAIYQAKVDRGLIVPVQKDEPEEDLQESTSNAKASKKASKNTIGDQVSSSRMMPVLMHEQIMRAKDDKISMLTKENRELGIVFSPSTPQEAVEHYRQERRAESAHYKAVEEENRQLLGSVNQDTFALTQKCDRLKQQNAVLTQDILETVRERDSLRITVTELSENLRNCQAKGQQRIRDLQERDDELQQLREAIHKKDEENRQKDEIIRQLREVALSNTGEQQQAKDEIIQRQQVAIEELRHVIVAPQQVMNTRYTDALNDEEESEANTMSHTVLSACVGAINILCDSALQNGADAMVELESGTQDAQDEVIRRQQLAIGWLQAADIAIVTVLDILCAVEAEPVENAILTEQETSDHLEQAQVEQANDGQPMTEEQQQGIHLYEFLLGKDFSQGPMEYNQAEKRWAELETEYYWWLGLMPSMQKYSPQEPASEKQLRKIREVLDRSGKAERQSPEHLSAQQSEMCFSILVIQYRQAEYRRSHASNGDAHPVSEPLEQVVSVKDEQSMMEEQQQQITLYEFVLNIPSNCLPGQMNDEQAERRRKELEAEYQFLLGKWLQVSEFSDQEPASAGKCAALRELLDEMGMPERIPLEQLSTQHAEMLRSILLQTRACGDAAIPRKSDQSVKLKSEERLATEDQRKQIKTHLFILNKENQSISSALTYDSASTWQYSLEKEYQENLRRLPKTKEFSPERPMTETQRTAIRTMLDSAGKKDREFPERFSSQEAALMIMVLTEKRKNKAK